LTGLFVALAVVWQRVRVLDGYSGTKLAKLSTKDIDKLFLARILVAYFNLSSV
jgi:hypothetical protein